jgi:hypothetical protein
MDDSKYWTAYQRGAEIAAAADVARACALGAAEIQSEAHSALRQTREHLIQLRTDPGRHGASMTRREIAAEIAKLERAERRQLIFLEAVQALHARHQGDLQRLMVQRASTARLLDQLTRDFEALQHSAEREVHAIVREMR